MFDCRQCQGIEEFFDQREAQRDLARYRKHGPHKTTQMLIDAMVVCGVEGRTLLDIGGGIGAIQHELLKAGVRRSTSVDASTAYVQAATEEAQRQGHSDRIVHRPGDFVDIAPDIEPADIVTLDRAICCYHDVESLVDLSSKHAARTYGLVYPRYNWVGRTLMHLFNFYMWLRRNPFRVFAHPTAVVDAIVQKNGLKQRFCRKTLIWQVVVYTH